MIDDGIPLQTRSVTTYSTYVVEGTGAARRRNGGRKTYEISKTITIPLDVIDPSIWGPLLWRILHVLSLLSPAPAWILVPKALDGALPCPECRTHYHSWFAVNPLSEYGSPMQWVLALHNAVNERADLPIWTEENIIDYYSDYTKTDIAEALDAIKGMLGSCAVDALTALLAAA